MDFRQITMMQKIKSGMDRFRANHPKFPLFLRAVSQDALVEVSKSMLLHRKGKIIVPMSS